MNMVFYGEHEVSITSGGRIALPKKIRESLAGSEFVVTRGFDACLAGYDRMDWERRAQSLLDVSLLEKEHIDKRRILFSSALYISIDDQGRAVLPKQIRGFAGLIDKAVIAGVGDHFEIWDVARWQAYQQTIQT